LFEVPVRPLDQTIVCAVNLIFAQFAAPAIEGESNNNYLINNQNKLLFPLGKHMMIVRK
jgi:hypothetical protein